jgi:hypothetical protein
MFFLTAWLRTFGRNRISGKAAPVTGISGLKAKPYSATANLSRALCKPRMGTRVLLRTSRSFSITTSGHCHDVGGAVRGHGLIEFFVQKLRGSWGDTDIPHAETFLIKEARDNLAKAKTLRFDSWGARVYEDDNPDKLPQFLGSVQSDFDDARKYAETFGLPIEFDAKAEIAAALDTWTKRKAAYDTPEAARKRDLSRGARERAKERKAEAQRERNRQAHAEAFEAWKAGNGRRPYVVNYAPNSSEHAELAAIEEAEHQQARREANEAFDLWQAGKAPRPSIHRYPYGSNSYLVIQADIETERALEEAALRDRWLNGTAVHFYGRDEFGGAYLRVRGDNVETSLGATVPLAHAVKAFGFIKLLRERGEAWQRNGKTVRVGHFQVDSIAPNGDIHAGCHFIKWEELARIAAAIGIGDMPADDSAVETCPSHVAA